MKKSLVRFEKVVIGQLNLSFLWEDCQEGKERLILSKNGI